MDFLTYYVASGKNIWVGNRIERVLGYMYRACLRDR